MKTLRAVCAVGLCTLALSPVALGQTAVPDFDLTAAVAAAQQQYTTAFAGHPQLFSGPEYVDYAKRYHFQEGHQFFLLPEKQTGSVYYNEHYFTNLKLSYDEVFDQVLISPPGSPLTLRLINENVRYFTINDHHFIRLVADSAANKVIRTGFFEVLLDSTVQVLAKRSKRMQERIVHPDVNVEFTAADKLFIRKGDQYYVVASKSSVLHLFADRSREVQKYIQEHKLRFKKDQREAAIVQITSYYCSLASH